MLGTFNFGTKSDAQGPSFLTRVSVTGETSYVTGGTTGLLAALRANRKDTSQIIGIIPQDCGGFSLVYDTTTDKLKVYQIDPTAGAVGPAPEVVAAQNISTTTFTFIVISY